MLRTNLSELQKEGELTMGSSILRARDLADKLSSSPLTHLLVDGEMISYPEDSVIFSEEPYEYAAQCIDSNYVRQGWNERYKYRPINEMSSLTSSWDGECIHDLVDIFKGMVYKLKIDNLDLLLRHQPVSLQSPRLSEATLNKYKCGIDASKTIQFYIDRNGLALVSLRHPMPLRPDERRLGQNAGYYICNQSDLPELISSNKERMHSRTEVYSDRAFHVTLDTNTRECGVKAKVLVSHIPTNDYGYTSKQTKHALEYICNERYTGRDTMSYNSGLSLADLSKFLDIAVRDKLIEVNVGESLDDIQDDEFLTINQMVADLHNSEPFYITTKGSAIGIKNNSKRMTRAKLNKQKDIIEARYLEAWEHIDKLHRIPVALGYFGSAINKDAIDFSDLDVTYLTMINDTVQQKVNKEIEGNPRRNPPYVIYAALYDAFEQGTYPIKPHKIGQYQRLDSYSHGVTKQFLQRKNKLISVHDFDEVISIEADFEIHYIGTTRLESPINNIDDLKNALKSISN
ncbi:conserved hypothetical protein [Vibrio chagasii]|nr:conserved hypothetical protein [Vibrio chagasii]